MYVHILISTTKKEMKASPPQEKQSSSQRNEAEEYKSRSGRKTEECELGAVYRKSPEGSILKLHITYIAIKFRNEMCIDCMGREEERAAVGWKKRVRSSERLN